ncbi:TlpA family protein disulfide reductase [Niabella beijingensis]|uniref:TlpA family protein disulfide reductase n=1 Tax=Niabella beijingensis TaxID=2872700 RepID=UPI001CBBADEF|nr:TlpA disulfide reductase family protein [Niabella beijingensis]MBZ4188957.1 TlpA family protein disulfide reductase [Niabella beijingensis]
MKKYLLAYALAGACLYAQAQGGIRPLTIGDTVPDITFNNLLNYPAKTAKLSDFRGKLVILDFWATWCASCIAAFPKLQKLQEDYKKDLQVLMIASPESGDDFPKISSLLNRLKKNNKAVNLPITINSEATTLFPHTALPHYVWIERDGRVLAITGADEVTTDNIKTALTKGALEVGQKKDFNKNNLFGLDSSIVPLKKIEGYSILIKGRMTNLNGGGGFGYYRQRDNSYYGYFFANASLISIYNQIAGETINDFDGDFARIVFPAADSNLLGLWHYPDTDSLIRWYNKNGYTLDFYGPPTNHKELFKKALWLLNEGTPFNAEIVIRKTTCLVLRRIDTAKECGNKNYTTIQYNGQQRTVAISDIKSIYKDWLNGRMPFVDRSGLKGDRYFKPDKYPLGIYDAQKVLAGNNLKITEEQLALPLMIITSKPKL